jgi:hypothetical protein
MTTIHDPFPYNVNNYWTVTSVPAPTVNVVDENLYIIRNQKDSTTLKEMLNRIEALERQLLILNEKPDILENECLKGAYDEYQTLRALIVEDK